LPQFNLVRVDDRHARSEGRNKSAGIDDNARIDLPGTRKMGVPHKDKARLRPENTSKISGQPRRFPPRLDNHEWAERRPELTNKESQARQAFAR